MDDFHILFLFLITTIALAGMPTYIIPLSIINEIPLEWFVTSGIIQLDNQIIDNKMRRTIKITKLRGIKHIEKIHSLELGNNGLYIYEN